MILGVVYFFYFSFLLKKDQILSFLQTQFLSVCLSLCTSVCQETAFFVFSEYVSESISLFLLL